MPLTFQSANVYLNTTPPVFTFDDTVAAYAVGFASFLFNFPDDDDHRILEFSLSLQPNQPAPNQVSVNVTAILKDEHGNNLDPGSSYVTVVVLAWVGETAGTLLSPQYTVGNGQQSPPIDLPGSAPSILQSFLSGFYLSYGDENHQVQDVTGAMGVGANQGQAYLSATAKMYDTSGNDAVNPTTTGALIASVDENPGFIVKTYTAQSSTPQKISMGKPLRAAVSLVTSFEAKFGDDDHFILQVGTGPNATAVNPSDDTYVTTSGVWSWMFDNNDDHQDNTQSHCTIIVIGILK
jgi:hypothetical protein